MATMILTVWWGTMFAPKNIRFLHFAKKNWDDDNVMKKMMIKMIIMMIMR